MPPKRRQDQARDLLERLERIEKGKLPRCVLLVGQARRSDRVVFDTAQADLILQSTRAWAHGAGEREWVEHDPGASNFEIDALCTDLLADSLFGEQRMIVVSPADALCKFPTRRKAKQRTAFEKAVVGHLKAADRGDRLLVILPGHGPEAVLAKEVAELKAEVWTLRPLYRDPPPWDPDPLHTEVSRFAMKRCQAAGLRLDAAATLALLERLAGDLGRLKGEIEKLRSMAGPDGRVKGKDVSDAVAGSAVEVDAYAFAEHILRGDRASALRWLRKVSLRGGRRDKGSSMGLSEVAARVQGVLVGETRKMLGAAELREAGQSPHELADILRVPNNPLARDSFARRLGARDREGFLQVLEGLLDLEQDIKFRSVGAEVALDRFVLRTCSPRR